MRKLLLICLCVLLTLSTVGCGKNAAQKAVVPKEDNSSPAQKAPDSKKKIALVMKTLTNPFFIEMEKGTRKAEQELNIDLIVRTGAKETSIEQQIVIVEELINDKVDAIVIAPGSSTELIPVLKKAQERNIKIVNIDNMLDKELSEKIGLIDIPFISVDNEEGAYKSAKYISDQIKKPTKLAILEGIRGANNAEQRKNGALRAFKENPNIKIVASETANWKIDEALDVTAKIFSKHSDIGAIFCANDMMALGAIQYIENNKINNVLVAGFDALVEAKQAIKNGKMQATIDQQASVQGYTGVKYAFEMLNGKTEPLETMVDVIVINSDNINR